jgi:hypothetical protein
MTAAERSDTRADARNVQQDTSTPRLVYRGKQDILGLGTHTDPDTGELIGENKAVYTQEELEAAAADGWRLTAEDPDAAEPVDEVNPLRGRPDSTPGHPHPDHDLPGRPARPTPKAKR